MMKKAGSVRGMGVVLLHSVTLLASGPLGA